MRTFVVSLILCLLPCGWSVADITPEQKKAISELTKALRTARSDVRRKKYDEVRKTIAEAEAKLASLEFAEDEKDRSYRTLLKSLATLKNSLPLSFEKQIAPILKDKCLNCHGPGRQRGQLRLDTFNHMARGGKSGALVRGNNPRNSLLVNRIATNDDRFRMPRNGPALEREQIQLISRWVSEGSGFDGDDRDALIGSPKIVPVKVARPDGSETVSFRKDIAPWMVNICMGCHGTRNPRNEFSLTTFESLMRGGESGEAVKPGDSKNSYIVDLVLRQDPLKMPAGQARLKRSQAMALAKWIDEGAKYDGGSPKQPLRELVPTPAELEAMKLANMSAAEFTARRLKQGQDMWERVVPRDEKFEEKTKNFYVFGADLDRTKQVAEWAEKDASAIAAFLKFSGREMWRGRLNVFIARDRFAYEEFNQVVFNRRTPKGMIGHTMVSEGFNQAYVVIQDVGDEVTAESMGMRTSLTVRLAEAFLRRSGKTPPMIVSRAVGLLLAAEDTKDDPWFKALPGRLRDATKAVTRPAEVFNDGSFAPTDLDPVALALGRFLRKSNRTKLVDFANELQATGDLTASARKVYRQSPAQIGTAFGRSLR